MGAKQLGWILIPPIIPALFLVWLVGTSVELPPTAQPLWVWFVSLYGLGVFVFLMEYLTRRGRGVQ